MSTRKEKKGDKDAAVRFNVYLPREAFEALERLRKMSGKRSLAETVRSALKLYLMFQEELEGGKEIVLQDKAGKDKKTLRFVSL